MRSSDKNQRELNGALGIALTHRNLQQIERRQRREDERTRLLLMSTHEDDTTRHVCGVSGLVCCLGFSTQQLTTPTLRPLERWYHQLQLLVADEAQSPRADPNIDPRSEEGGDHDDDHATALRAFERVLAQDGACFDLGYAAGASVQDVSKSLLDSTSSLPEEILSFSTMKSGLVCRVTCVHHYSNSADNRFAFHSSLFVRDFDAKTAQLLLLSPPSQARSLIELVWSELSAAQP